MSQTFQNSLLNFVNITRYEGEIQWLKRATRKDLLFDGSFQEAIGSILAMAQCFGMMPVVGVKSSSAAELKFNWRSLRTFYSLMAFLFTLVYAGMTFWITLNNEIHFDRMGESVNVQYCGQSIDLLSFLVPVIFYGSAVYGMFCFGRLATKWPRIMRRWESIESKLPKYRSQKEKRKLAYHLKMLAFVVLMSSLGKIFVPFIICPINEQINWCFSGTYFEHNFDRLLCEKVS